MHFGLEGYLGYVEYFSFIAAWLLAIFWKPIIGIFYLVPLLPLQTLRYRLNDFPLGESVVGVMLLGVVLGLLRKKEAVIVDTPWTKLLIGYSVFTFVSLCLGSLYLGTGVPMPGEARFGAWQDYMTMPAMLLLTAAVSPSKRQMLAIILLMCAATLALDRSFGDVMSGRDLSVYRDDLRESSSMGYAGSNGLAAFEAQITVFALALSAFEPKFLLRMGYYLVAFASGACLLYSFSRGGYLALLFGLLFVGLVKHWKLLLAVAIIAAMGTAVLPQAVQQRILMSYNAESGSLDHSSETRVALWEDAIQVFDANAVLGTGFGTYAYEHRLGNYEDTHNIYLKVLVETGIVGIGFFALIVGKTLRCGYRLFRSATDPFCASLGLGLAAWVVCAVVANCFGDRWMFLQVNAYMWIIAGLVARSFKMESQSGTETYASAAADTPASLAPSIAEVT